jgi:hypothetical protein
MLEALSWSFAHASDAPTITAVLQGLLALIKLAGLMGPDQLCELCVGALARASGVFDPAPCSTLAEQKQLVALQGLLGLAQAPEAGLLGSSWVILLRVVSTLDVLKVRRAALGVCEDGSGIVDIPVVPGGIVMQVEAASLSVPLDCWKQPPGGLLPIRIELYAGSTGLIRVAHGPGAPAHLNHCGDMGQGTQGRCVCWYSTSV